MDDLAWNDLSSPHRTFRWDAPDVPPTPAGGHIWETRSDDRGYNWTEADQTEIPNPNAGFDIQRTRDGNHFLIDNPVAAEIRDGRNELALFMSEDDCETWPYQFYLKKESPAAERDGGHEGVGKPEFTYGNIIQAADGTIHLAYEYRTSGIKHVELTEEEVHERGSGDPIVPEIATA